METSTELQAKMCESRIKEIFAKETLKEEDVALGNYFLSKWKRLTNHVERTESPIVEPQENFFFKKFAY
jgi:hypothetical protein